MKKLEKTRKIMSGFDISAAILSRRRQPVASEIALDPLRRSMRLVTYRRTDRASETTCKYDTFLSFLFGIRPRRPSGAIRSEYSPDGGVQWLRAKPWTPSIGQCRRCVPAHHLKRRNGSDGGALVRRRRLRDRPKPSLLT